MADIVLIHGYGVGITPQQSLTLDLGFSAFYEGLVSRDVALFSWYQNTSSGIINFLNIPFHYLTYQKERTAADSEHVLRNLKRFIEKEKPEIVVCHSLGAYLFVEYVRKYHEEPSIKKAVLVQADMPSTITLPPNSNKIQFINVFCPWDPALFTSKFMHHYTPAGLTGWKAPGVKNKFIPLFGHWNLHASTIAQKQFAKFVASL